MKKRIISLLLTLALAFTLVPAAFADSSDCGISYCTCSGHCSFGYTDYQYESSTMHSCIAYCTGCGKTSGVRQLGSHNMVNGVCTECGYSDGTGGGGGGDWEPDICYHWSTYRSWSGCRWYEYCYSCGALVDSGVSHGATVYGAWQYYSSAQHRRFVSCADCGEGSYEYAGHSTTTRYNTYTSSQHKVQRYCSTCGSYVGSATYESHSFTYGSWQNYSATQHRRTKTCSDCGYSTYEYADHSLSYGSWSSYSDTQHRRKVSCSGCSYSTYEYADHADANGDGLCDGCGKQLAIYVDVTLDACGGVLTDDEVTVIYGNTYGELPEPTREGYIFDGWFTAETGGELKALLTPEEYEAARGSTLNAHYTSPTVIRAIYEAVGGMGFEGGRILEPSMGVGNFFGLLPESMANSRLYGVELDSITGRMLEACAMGGSVDGMSMRPICRVDGVSMAGGQAFVTLLREIVSDGLGKCTRKE